ncbi:hypothetical protein PENTCL1PPCAC_5274, partial [Pristionchus entomophagus]
FQGPVRIYYGLEGFYQNNLDYAKSRSENQLHGKLTDTEGCEPLETRIDPNDGIEKPIAPCGSIANSLFNGIFLKEFCAHSMLPETCALLSLRGIISDFVVRKKYANPLPKENETLCDAFKGTVRPPWWTRDVCQLGAPLNAEDAARDSVGIGLENIDLIIWMRVAALPKFRKIYRIVDDEHDDYTEGLPAGNYTLRIGYNYPTSTWHGKKFFYVTSESWAGGRHFPLAIAYLAVGAFLLLISALFLLMCLRMRFLERVRVEAQMQ